MNKAIPQSETAIRKFVLIIILLSTSLLNLVQAQLTGTKNIPGDYPTLAAAVTDLNVQGVGAGGVIFNLLAGNPQSVPAGGYIIGGTGSAILSGPNATSATKTAVFQGNLNILTASGSLVAGNLNDGIFKLIGADWISIQAFNMQENAANVINTPAASNNMTEWGVALLYESATDGSQNNTIQNNIISLNKSYQNSFGVYSNVRHTASDVITAADITDAVTGPNHSNKVYGNTINNVSFGIVFIGSATAANMDNANDIGGASLATANNITNYGGLGALSAFNSFPTTIVVGAYLFNQNNFNLSFNTFVSASLNTAVALRGILTDYSAVPIGGITNNVNSNTVSFTQAGTGTFQCITTASTAGIAANVILNLNQNLIINNNLTAPASAVTIFGVANLGAFGTVNMNSNIVRANTSTATTGGLIGVTQQGAVVNTVNMNNNQIGDAIAGAATFTVATTGQINPILNSMAAATATVNMNNNIIRGFSVVSTGQVTAVSNQAAGVGVAINIKDNQIGTATANCYTYSAASSGAFVPIFNSNGAATALLTITGNDVRGIVNNVVGSGAHIYIQNQTFTGSVIISNNTFTNIVANTTGSVTFMGNSISRAASTTCTVNNNSVVGTYNKPGAGGTILFYNSFAVSPATVTETNNGNNFSNLTFTGATTITGWRCSDGTGVTGCPKTVTNNIFNNIVGGTSSVIILQCSFGTTATVQGNSITNISAAAATTAFTSSSGNNTIQQNVITGVSSTVGAVVGLSITGAASSVQSVIRNKIGNLQATNAAGTVNGILVSAGATVNLINNLIGDLRAPITSSTVDAIRGINITSTTATTNINVYYNTININAQSTGANFHTSGLFHTFSTTATTATLDMRNNVIVNNSTANGSGLTVAFRRSAATNLNNYATTSNNNLFWAGGVGACTSRFIYHDGTTGFQLAPFKALVAPRETASVSEDPQFVSTTATSGSFLHIVPSIPTQIESGAVTIGSVTNDFDGDVRSGTPDIGADEFAGIVATACSGTPTAGTATAVSSPICSNQSATICLGGQTPPLDVTIQWKSSLVSGGPYTDIVCANSNCYTTGPLTPGTYYFVAVVTCANSGLSSQSNQVTVVVNGNPNAAVTPPAPIICSGTSVVLTASGGTNYSWSPATGLNTTSGPVVTASPTATTTYVVTVTDVIGCSATASVTVTVLSAPSVSATATPASICSGGTSQLNALVCLGLPSAAYSLSNLTGQTYTTLTGGGITVINTAAQLTQTMGSANQDDGGVVVTLPFVFTYNCNNFTQMSMCTNGWLGAGNQGTIDAISMRTPGNFFTTAIPNNTIAAWFKDMAANFPLGTGSMRHGLIGTDIYAFQWDNANGSGFTDPATVLISFQVNIYGPASTAPGRIEIIYGPTVGALAFAAAEGIEDAVGGTGRYINAIDGSSTTTTLSTVWPGNGNGYRFSPVVPSYAWSPPTYLNNTTIPNPIAAAVISTTTYTVTVTASNGCSGTASVTVNASPVITITETDMSGIANNDGIICAGSSATLTASGGISYLWSSGSNTASTTVSPTTTTVYTVTVTDENLCTATATATITVTPLPTPGITGNTSACIGDTVNLTATGGTSYLWATGETTASISFPMPGAPSIICVTVTDNGCSSATCVALTPLLPPIVVITGPDSVCVGTGATLSVPAGFPGYLWSTGETTNSITVFPASLTVYTVTVTSGNGCTAVASHSVDVNAVPTYTFSTTDVSNCNTADGAITITMTGGESPFTFSWTTPNGCGVNPTAQNQSGICAGGYFMTVTDINGCSNTGVFFIDGPSPGCFSCPTITSLTAAPTPICPNVPITLTASGLAGMGVTYGIQFKYFAAPTMTPYVGGTIIATVPNGSLGGGGTSAQTVASFPTPGTYFIYAILSPSPTDPNCVPFATTTVVINAIPTGSIAVTETSGVENNDGTICAGASATLTAPAGTGYLWSTGATTQMITVTPASTTPYSVTVTNALGCTAVFTTTINVNPLPIAAIAPPSAAICAGSPVTLTASGGGTYLWSTGATTAAITVSPAGTTTYTVTVTSTAACSATASAVVNVVPVPVVNPVANQTYCVGSSVPSVVFTSSTPGTVFNWTRTAEAIGLAPVNGTGNVPAFTATNAGTTPLTSTFTVTPSVTSNGITCTGTPITFTITINPTPQVNAVVSQTYCAGSVVPSIVFAGNVPGATYSWTRTSEAIGAIPTAGTGSVPSFTATNAGVAPLTSTFTVVASFTNNGVTCTGTPITFTITINPVPTINAVANQTYCAGSSVPAINFTSNVAGAVFNWTRTNFPIGAIPLMGVGGVPTFIATNAGTTPISSVFTVTASYTNGGVTCTSTPITFTITVNPTPVVTPVPNQTFCAGANVPPIFFNSNVPGAVLTWTRTGDDIGLGPVSGTGNIPPFTGINNTNGPLVATITVVGTYTNNGVTCTSAPITFTITICYSLGTQRILGDAFVCPGQIVTYSVENPNPNSNYDWIIQNGGGEIINDNGSSITIQWDDIPGGPFLIQLDATGCGNACHSFDYLPVFIQGVDAVTCNDNVQISLNENCIAEVLSGMILEGEVEGNNNYFVVLTDAFGNNIPDAIITGDYIGQTVNAMVLNECNGQSCWGTISVEDKIPPVVECTDVTLSCGTSLEPIFEPPVTGNAIASVNPGAAIGPNQGVITNTDLVLDLPSNAVITDVNVTVDLVHTWSGDLNVVLISPEGTEVLLADAVCGSADNWSNVTFDDQAGILVNNACNNNPPPALLSGSVIPQELLGVLNGQSPLGTWRLRITDLANGDAGTLNLFGLNVAYYLSAPNAPAASDACGEVNLTYTDSYAGEDCEDVTLTRTWTATDGSGNTATCNQIITIIPLTLDNITFPDAYVGNCGESVLPDHTGWPTVDGQPITDENNICNIFVGYWDKELNECGGGRKIVRTWTILDWCTVETVEAVQVIKLQDTQGPVLTCPQDYEVGTDFWYCYANVSVPKPGATDECSEVASYSLTASSGTVVSFGNNFVINGLGLGTHTVTWTVADECGNKTTCSFEITVVDDVVPVANCDGHTIVALTNDGPKGITLVPANVFDDGSYDNCGPVTFRARRMDSCIDFDWTTEGACIDDTPGGIPPVNSRDRGTVHRPCVPFSCCDVGAGPIMVELEVTDAAGNVNFCMVEATVQDKISPFVECPADIVVSCDFWFNVQEGTFVDGEGNNNGALDEDPLSAVFGNMYDAFRYDESIRENIIINDPSNDDYHPQPYNWGLDGWADDNCEVNLQVRVRVIDDCSGGELPGNAPDGAVKLIERRFSASDGNDGVAPGTCTQRIWVVDFDPFYITDNTCNNSNPQDGVIWPCDVLLTTCPEDLGNLGAPTLFDDACSLIGVTYEDTRFDFVDGACYKILREWAVIDWCQYNSQTGEGLWHYTQVIKVHDEDGPAFVEPCETVTLCVADDGVSLPDNNQAFLGEDNPLSSSCSVHLNLSRVVHETCSDIVNYDVKIYPFNGTDYILIKPTSQAVVDSATNDATLSFDTRQSTIQAIRLNGIPYNSQWCGDYHRILWSVEDGCGNWSHCEYLFRLEDCKQPSPVCINGLSTVVMPVGGQVTVWAKDFNASSFDDCTPEADLLYSFSGDTYTPSYTYTCENVPAFNVEIATQIWVADGGTDDNCNSKIEWSERNKDYCSTTIVITDNAGVCDTSFPIAGGILAGEVLTDFADAIANVNVKLTSPGHFFPQYVTAQDGQFEFDNVPLGNDYVISTERNDDHKNGVSTLDLVRIQKHLLGKELFTTPYQYIAADANNTQSVSAIDLIEIRKLILGIYTEFPANKSWRFVQEGYQMNPENPWPFNEIIQLPALANDSVMHNDFVGVKVGDVNNTAKANVNQILPRNGHRVLHVALEGVSKVKTGDVVEVKLRMPESVEGFQWTLETAGLTYDGVSSETMNINDSNIGLLGDGVITMSWNAEGEQAVLPGQVVSMRFIATASGNLESMIHLNGRVTEAEAYTPEGEILDVKLGHTDTDAEFALYQNEPNPFKGNTVIGYDLPETCNVTLTIFDITGKVVYLKEQESVKGYNMIIVNSKELPSVGVMYYRLDAKEYNATKKMIIIE